MIKHLQKLGALVTGFALLGSTQVLGQANPVPQNLPYNQNFEGVSETATSYPDGISGWLAAYSNTKEKAESSVASADAPIKFANSAQTSGSSIYYYRVEGNSQLYIQQTSNTSNGSNQLAAAIHTTGAEQVFVKYTVELLNDQNRSAGLTLQYRVGETGAWGSVENSDYTSLNKALNSKETFDVTLPVAAANQEVVQLRWITYENVADGVTGSRDGIGIDNVSISSSTDPAPADETAPSVVSLSPENEATGVSLNSMLVLTFNEAVVANAANGITISNITKGTSTVIAADDADKVSINGGSVTIRYTFEPETNYSVAVAAGAFKDAAGNTITELPANNWVFTTQGVGVPLADTYAENFDNCSPNGSATLSGNWMHYSVTGAETWACSEFGQDNTFGVQMNGYNGGAKQNEDWLISPAYNMQEFTLPVMSVNYITKYGGPALQVKVSTDYSGSGDPSAATWSELMLLDSDNADAWKQLQDINLTAYKSEGTHIAFVYTSTTSAAARWTLDNFSIENASSLLSLNPDELNFNFGTIAVGSASDDTSFTFSAIGYEQDVVLTAPTGFELSKDNSAFGQSLTYTSGEAASQNTVYVRFKPATAAVFAGAIAFTSGTTLNEERGMLQGSSLDFASTLDIATWNLEWFGSTSNGPSNEELQYANAKKGIMEMNADIIAVQEIVDVALIKKLAEELGYKYEDMDTEWLFSNSQRTGVLYRPEILTVKKEKTLLSTLYADIKAGRTTLDGYPANSSTFWASGRLPYLVQFEANINGVRQYINIINIHAKANSGDDITQYQRRKYDVQVLKDSLDAQYANTNLVMLGDFNDDVDESVVPGAEGSSYKMYVDDINYKALTYELSLTGAYDLVGSYKSFLDHIVISKGLEDEYIANSIAIRKDFLNSIENYGTTTSDHLPVMARFQLVTSDPEQETPTGIADATKGQFSVYPNPVQNFVRLALPERVRGFQDITLVAYGIDGRVLFTVKGSQEGVQQQLNTSVSSLKQGMYILKIEAGKEVFVARMLKK